MTQQELVKKIYFPREVLPISFVTSQFVNMLLSFIVVLAVLLLSGKGLHISALIYLPIIMAVEYILALGFVFVLSTLTVFFRDLEYLVSIVVMAWQFLSPVLYSVEQVPEQIQWILNLNPMTPIITSYRDILYYGQQPKLLTLLQAFCLGTAFLLIGAIVFRKSQRHFAEEL